MAEINGYMRFMKNNLQELERYEYALGDIKDSMKLAMESIKNRTLNRLLDLDKEYQDRLREQRMAYNLYEQTEFSEKQREVVDMLIARNEEANFDKSVNEYMAGMIDAYSILKLFGLTNEHHFTTF